MTSQPADVYGLIAKLRYDLSAAQAKVTDITNLLNELNLPDSSRATCPECGLTFKGEGRLAEHRYMSHDGPVPAHLLEAEQRAVDYEPPAQGDPLRAAHAVAHFIERAAA